MQTFTRIFIISIFINFTFFAKAQTVEYKTENYTKDLAPLKISICPLALENMIFPITAGVMAEGHLKNRIFYNVQFRAGYLRNFLFAKEDVITTQKESKGTFFEAGVDFPFVNRTKAGKMKVVTNTVNYGNIKQESYFKAECEVRRFWSLSGGIMQYSRPRYNNSETSNYIISNEIPIRPAKDNFTHYNQSTFAFFAGLSRRKVKKAIINSGGYNYRRFYGSRFYAHVMIGATSIDDVVVNNVTYKIDNAKQVPLGYRLGWQWDQMGVVTGFEFGKMPDVTLETPTAESELAEVFSKNPFNYLRFTFQFVIINNDKNYKMYSKK